MITIRKEKQSLSNAVVKSAYVCGFFILREVIMGEYYIIGLLVIDSMCFVEREVLSYFSSPIVGFG